MNNNSNRLWWSKKRFIKNIDNINRRGNVEGRLSMQYLSNTLTGNISSIYGDSILIEMFLNGHSLEHLQQFLKENGYQTFTITELDFYYVKESQFNANYPEVDTLIALKRTNLDCDQYYNLDFNHLKEAILNPIKEDMDDQLY